MISNIHSASPDPMSGAVDGARRLPRPDGVPHPYCEARLAFSPCQPGDVSGPHPVPTGAGRNQFCPVLSMTRRSPAGPKPEQPMVTSGLGAVRVYGPRMLGNGETFPHAKGDTFRKSHIHGR